MDLRERERENRKGAGLNSPVDIFVRSADPFVRRDGRLRSSLQVAAHRRCRCGQEQVRLLASAAMLGFCLTPLLSLTACSCASRTIRSMTISRARSVRSREPCRSPPISANELCFIILARTLRCRLQSQDDAGRRSQDQDDDLGHGWSGAIPNAHELVLPWRPGHRAGYVAGIFPLFPTVRAFPHR
jgi:hypothetical protein